MQLARAFFTACAQTPLFYRRRDCLKPLLEEKNDPRAKAAAFLDCLQMLLRDALLAPYGSKLSACSSGWDGFVQVCEKTDREALTRAIAAAEEAAKSVRLGYNTGYTLRQLCLDLLL